MVLDQEEMRKKGWFEQLYTEKGVKPEEDRAIDFSFLKGQQEKVILPNPEVQKEQNFKKVISNFEQINNSILSKLDQEITVLKKASVQPIDEKALKPRQLLQEYKQNKVPLMNQRHLEFLAQRMKELEERVKRLEDEKRN